MTVFRPVFLLDILLAGMAQASLSLGLAAPAALLGVLLTVCKIVVGQILKNNPYLLS